MKKVDQQPFGANTQSYGIHSPILSSLSADLVSALKARLEVQPLLLSVPHGSVRFGVHGFILPTLK